MFVLDSFLHWVLTTVTAAAEAERHDDTALRERLLEAEMRRELGEISDDEFAAVEADLLAGIRAIAARRQGMEPGTPVPAPALERTPDAIFQVEVAVVGDFHEPDASGEPAPGRNDAPGGTVPLVRDGGARRRPPAPAAALTRGSATGRRRLLARTPPPVAPGRPGAGRGRRARTARR